MIAMVAGVRSDAKNKTRPPFFRTVGVTPSQNFWMKSVHYHSLVRTLPTVTTR